MTSTERKYDELADHYEEVFPYVADVGRQLVDYVDPAEGMRVLDVGAGRGAVARAALGRGCVVTAVDSSQRMVELLIEDFPEVGASQMDAGQLDFPASSFDLVMSGFVVQVLEDPGLALAEAKRVLASGAMLAMSLETQSVGRLRWLYELAAEFLGVPVPSDDDEENGSLTSKKLNFLLAETGFVDIATQSVEMPVPLADAPALWEWLKPRGLADAIGRLSSDQAERFHRRFLAGADRMRTEAGIVLDFRATLHKAHTQ